MKNFIFFIFFFFFCFFFAREEKRKIYIYSRAYIDVSNLES